MSRSRKSAKAAGTDMEVWSAEYIAARLGDDRIERRAKNGNKDRGDITGVRTVLGQRVVIEVKDVVKLALGPWIREAEIEKGNDDAAVAAVIHKRVGFGRKRMAEQFVTMRLGDFTTLLGATPEGHNEGEAVHGES